MDPYEYANQQATLARQRAMRAGGVAREELLRFADLWDAVAHEYRQLAKTTFDGPTAA
jgi:hypothetical protein